MRGLFIVIGCLLSYIASAQEVAQHRFIRLVYVPNRSYVEKAVKTIEAVNYVPSSSRVEYQAGQSVMLKPGFRAEAGSQFIAHIKSVKGEEKLLLTTYPNPFERSTTIEYVLPEPGTVSLYVVDSQGRLVSKLLESNLMPAGRHHIDWVPETLLPGLYIPILEAGGRKAYSRTIKK